MWNGIFEFGERSLKFMMCKKIFFFHLLLDSNVQELLLLGAVFCENTTKDLIWKNPSKRVRK